MNMQIKRVGVSCLLLLLLSIGQSIAQLSISATDTEIKNILRQIEEKSNYTFFYSDDFLDINQKMNIHAKDETIENILNILFQNTNIDYRINNTQIALSEKIVQRETPANTAQQQGRKTISGTVRDNEGNPIIGATIMEKGNPSHGTITDIDGNFILTNTPENATLQFTYVGMKPQEIPLSGRTTINIVMETDVELLDELVVVGYTTTSKRSLISSVSQVVTEELPHLPSTNITQSLAGRAPGLIVESGSGLNARSSVSIRGGGDPIYVIDGVIRSGTDFANLNSEDIESISILKDASSTAVYGARAAYGIVQVTTKSGKTGKTHVTYAFQQTWGQPSFWANRVSSYENALKINEARINEGLDPQYSDEALEKYRTGSDPGQYPNTDWRAAVLKNWAPVQRHNIALTGGTELNNYYTSVGYTDMNSLFKSGRYTVDRVNYNLSNTTNIKDVGLRVTAQLSGFIESSDDLHTSEGSGHNFVIQQTGMMAPDEIAVNKYGLPYDVAVNPVAISSQDAGYMRSKLTVVNGLLNVEWALPWVEGFGLKATGNYNWYDRNNKNWRNDAAKYGWDSTEPLYAAKPQLNHSDTQGLKWTLQYFANYNRIFGDHSFNALAGYEAAYERVKGIGLNRYNYTLPIDQINFGPTDGMDNSASEVEAGRAGMIAQLKYGFKNRYYIEGAYRHDGSDIFPKHNRWGDFFSFSAGWTLSDEPFMQALNEKDILDLMKIRVSYGQVGMDQGITRFSFLDLYNYNATGYVFDGNMYPTLYEGSTPSVNITWYKDKQYGLGFDFASLNNRLYGMFDYFLFITAGYMADPDPQSAGYIDPYGRGLPQIESEGEKRRAGFDFQLGYRDHFEDFKYDVGFNFTKYDVYWSNYPWESLDTKKNPYTRQTGQYEHFSQVGYHYIKTANSAQEWQQYAQRQGSTNLTGGDFIYEDFNGDGRLTGEDQYRIGYSSKPLINYGIIANFNYKGFGLNILFQGAGKRDIPIDRTMWNYNYLSRYDYQLDYWREDNQGAKFPRIVSSQSVNGNNNLMPSEAWTFNGSYFRLKSLIFSYDLKYSLLKNTNWLNICRLSLTGQNLFTLSEATKYGIDPEVSNIYNVYPIERVIGINLNLGF
jgi:TonB-linked SusC/RagA family outer membrane protein